MNNLVKEISNMILRIPEPALLYTLDKKIKSITLSGNKACISNDSLTIAGIRFYHTVGGLGSCPRVRDLAGGPGVLPEGAWFCLSVRGSIFWYADIQRDTRLKKLFHFFVVVKVSLRTKTYSTRMLESDPNNMSFLCLL